MGGGAGLKPETSAFLREEFGNYYIGRPPEPYPRLSRREFGLIPFGGRMMRHLTFTRENLATRCAENPPQHLYASVAYYDLPGHPDMEGKLWKGADLVFDIDFDHLEGAARLTYRAGLNLAALHADRLVDTLRNDLGFESIRLTFSGGRGYHVVLIDPGVWSLDSHMRREIADYLTGEGFEAPIRPTSPPRRGAAGIPQWRNRILTADVGRSVRIRGIGIDAPVTADIKRLLRVPGSIHGKTGMVAHPLDPDQRASSFDPLTEALPLYAGHPVVVETSKPIDEWIGNVRHVFEQGRRIEVPRRSAVFLCASGRAEVAT